MHATGGLNILLLCQLNRAFSFSVDFPFDTNILVYNISLLFIFVIIILPGCETHIPLSPFCRFACPFCGKCVRSKENLKLHVRKHTGERPFVCLFCGRAFGGKSDLTRHLRIHTGERPYHCEACGKCFARADYLSKHLTTHIHNGPR